MTNYDDRTLLADIIKKYDVGSLDNYRRLGGWDNEPYFIRTTVGDYLLKIYRKNSSQREHLLLQISLLKFLRQKGLPVHEVIPANNSDELLVIDTVQGKCKAILFRFIFGNSRTYEAINVNNLHAVSEVLYRMHFHMKKFECNDWCNDNLFKDWNEIIDSLDRKILSNLSANIHSFPASEITFLEKSWKSDRRIIENYLDSVNVLDYQLIHSDLTPVNVILSDNEEIVGFLDFDKIRMGSVLEDLAVLCGSWLLNAKGISAQEVIDAIVKGYSVGGDQVIKVSDLLVLIRLYIWQEVEWASGQPMHPGESMLWKHKLSLETFVSRYKEIDKLE